MKTLRFTFILLFFNLKLSLYELRLMSYGFYRYTASILFILLFICIWTYTQHPRTLKTMQIIRMINILVKTNINWNKSWSQTITRSIIIGFILVVVCCCCVSYLCVLFYKCFVYKNKKWQTENSGFAKWMH
jgi:hypothetical protein